MINEFLTILSNASPYELTLIGGAVVSLVTLQFT
jgi:hypothetical protein